MELPWAGMKHPYLWDGVPLPGGAAPPARGVVFVVEMQVLNVAGFVKRVVYNASRAYVGLVARSEP